MELSHLNALRALEATLRSGSFSAAAREIGVTPAAVGQQVRALEDFIGRPLFDRKPTGLTAVPEALDEAERLTRAFRDLSGSLAALRRPGDARSVSITLTHSIAELWLSPRLPEFYARTEHLNLRLETSFDVVSLKERGLDFAIRFLHSPGPGYSAEPLFPEVFAPIATPDFAERYGLTPDTRSLDGVPLLNNRPHASDATWLDWDGWSAATGIPLGERPQMSEMSLFSNVLRFASAGLGLALGGILMIADDLNTRRLILPLGSRSIRQTRFRYHLVWPRDARLTPVQAAFRDWIVEKARDTWTNLMDAVGPDGAEMLEKAASDTRRD